MLVSMPESESDLPRVHKDHYFRHLTDRLYFLYLAIHTSFIVVFYLTNVQELVFFNFVSVVCYVFALWLNSKKMINTAYAMATIEVCMHAFLCSRFIGDAGFTEAILFLPMLFFIHPASTRLKLTYFIVIVGFYIWLIYNDQFAQPLYDFDQRFLDSFQLGTSILIVVIDSYIAYYAYSIIKLRQGQFFLRKTQNPD